MAERVPILMYHSVSNQTNSKFREFAISPRLFGEQMMYLKQHEYGTLTVTEFAQVMNQDRTLPNRPVVLTFDDGFADFHTNAYPVLERLHLTATLYATTAFVGDTSRWLKDQGQAERPMLSWDQLREMSAKVVEIGAHGHTHAPLDGLSRKAAQDEIVRSKQILEDNLQKQISSFAYPYGYYRASVQDMVRSAGYSSACAVRYRASSIHDDPFALARLMITASTDMKEFTRLLTGNGISVSQQYKRVRASVWRFIRHAVSRSSHTFPGKMETA